MTTTQFIRPLNLQEYLDAGGVLAGVLPTRASLMVDSFSDRSDNSVAKRREIAGEHREFAERIHTSGGAAFTGGMETSREDLQELIWLESFRADLVECADEAQVERVAALMPPDDMVKVRETIAQLRCYSPIRIDEPGNGLGWRCDNCGKIHEPGQAEAMIVTDVSGDPDYKYCRACVSMALEAWVVEPTTT